MATVYDYGQLLDLLRRGGSVERSGTYAVWVWARSGSQVRLALDGRALGPTHTAGRREGRFSWERAGAVELRQGTRFALHLDFQQSALADRQSPGVGFLAISADRGFDPRRSFEVQRVFVDQTGPAPDERLAETRGVHTPWTLRTYATRAAWEARAGQIRLHILTCLGLWPSPEKGPLNSTVFGRIEREEYSVEKVFFESLPGYFVCGNLYRPIGKKGPFPGIACPHGHWGRGRLEDSELGSVPGRCIGLARQGHVAFSYDMAGYVDSGQVDHRGFGGRREDLWGIGVMGLQLWNSIRVIDFLETLDEVDSGRIGCTGASGGGTQTFALTAVDDRVRAAAPVNMVSAHMQGGCNCENQAHLRLEINNVEIAACAAPRPLLLVSATGDWTVDTPELEFPAIRDIYRLYGAEEQVGCLQVEAGHNYNRESREAMYAFFGRVFLGEEDRRKFREKPFQVEKEEDLRVFAGRPLPAGALEQAGVLQALIDRSERRLEVRRPGSARDLRRFRKDMGPALQHALGAGQVAAENLYIRRMGRTRRDGFVAERLLLGRQEQGERVPALLFLPHPVPGRLPAVLAVHPEGKAALADGRRGRPGPLVAGLLSRGCAVLAPDLFATGESGSPLCGMVRDGGEPHFHTYNQAVAASRVQDLLTGIAYLNGLERIRICHLLGLGRAGIYCLLARALCAQVGRTAVDFARLDAADDHAWLGEDFFVPALRGAGDVRTAAVLGAPGWLLVHNAGRQFPTAWARGAYRAAGRPERLRIETKRLPDREVLAWIAQDGRG